MSGFDETQMDMTAASDKRDVGQMINASDGEMLLYAFHHVAL